MVRQGLVLITNTVTSHPVHLPGSLMKRILLVTMYLHLKLRLSAGITGNQDGLGYGNFRCSSKIWTTNFRKYPK